MTCFADGGLGAALVGCILGVTGCGVLSDEYAAPTEAPPAMRFVLENPAEFSTEPIGVQPPSPGDGADQPAAVDGCWAACVPSTGTAGQQQVCEVLLFDAENATLERQIYTNILSLLITIEVQQGTYTPAEDDPAAWVYTVTGIRSTLTTGSLEDVSDDYATLPVYDVVVVAEDGALITYFDEADDPRTVGGFADRVAFTHQPLACP